MSENIDAGAESANEVLDTIDSGLEEVAEEITEDEELEASDDVEVGDEVDGEELVASEDATDEELEEILDDEDASEEEVQQAAVELKKRLTIKVNGEEYEEEVDFEDEDGLREILQKGYAADSKFQEAANLKKQVEGFISSLQQNPFEALKDLGYNVDDLTDTYMNQRIQDLEKTPEQLEIEELRRELEAEKKLKDDREAAVQEEEIRAAEENFSRTLDNDITQALSVSELPQSEYVVKRIADNLITAFELGYEDVTVEDVMPVVETQIRGEIQKMFEAMPEDTIEKMLGKDVSTKLRKRRIKRAKKSAAPNSSVKSTGNSELKKAKSEEVEKPPTASKDFFKNIGSF